MNASLPDFADAWSNAIRNDGSMVRVTLSVAWPCYSPDHDGLLMTGTVFTPTGDLCMVSVLFPMSFGAAITKVRQGRLPVADGDYITVKRRIDEVVGLSGERYSRFEASREECLSVNNKE